MTRIEELKQSAIDENVTISHIGDFMDEAKEIANNPNKIYGLATGYTKLDQLLMGLDKGELIIVSADTTTGKTLFAQNIIRQAHLSSQNPLFSTLIFTLEMPPARFLSRFYKMYEDAEALPIYVYDNTRGVTIEKMRKAIVKCKENAGVGLILIDMLNSLPGTGENITTEITRNVKEIKKLAIEFNIPIILTAHTRRRQGTDSKLPTLDDLKDSSTTGQDADTVILLSRDDQNEKERYKLNVYVAKNRNKGRTGTLPMEINFNNLVIRET